jgi:hypothetical protein
MQARQVLKNKHFNRLAAIIRVPFHSSEWRQEHYRVDFWSMIESLDGAIEIDSPEYILETLTSLLVAITKADSNLSYSPEDFDWIVEVLEDGDREMVFRLFQAWYAAEDKVVTSEEAAEITGEAASTWRNRANRGEVPGARKMGKTWLLPVSALRMMGVAPIARGTRGKDPDVALVFDESKFEIVKDMRSQDLDWLASSLLARRNEIMAARLEKRGLQTRTKAELGEHTIYFRYILVYDPTGESPAEWATLEEARILLDTVRELEPAEAFARWQPKVTPLEREPYTRDEALRDMQAERAEAKRLYEAGELDAEMYQLFHSGARDYLDLVED